VILNEILLLLPFHVSCISPSLDDLKKLIVVCSLDLKLVSKKLAETISCKFH
jgi:hypothetical protein